MLRQYIKVMKNNKQSLGVCRILLLTHDTLLNLYTSVGFANRGQSSVVHGKSVQTYINDSVVEKFTCLRMIFSSSLFRRRNLVRVCIGTVDTIYL